MAKGVGLRRLSRRGSWVQIPPPALEKWAYFELVLTKRRLFLDVVSGG
jgi:hypothetical protein